MGGKSRPTGIRSLDCPACSQSLFRLSYPAHQCSSILIKISQNSSVTCFIFAMFSSLHSVHYNCSFWLPMHVTWEPLNGFGWNLIWGHLWDITRQFWFGEYWTNIMWTLHEELYVLHCAPSVGQGILVIGVSREHTFVNTCSSACSVEYIHRAGMCVSSY